jgi:hypothetical protein
MNSLYTHVPCHGFFLVGHKEFGSLLITVPLTWWALHGNHGGQGFFLFFFSFGDTGVWTLGLALVRQENQEFKASSALVAYACKTSYLGEWDQEDLCLRPAWANSLWDTPISKITRAKWTRGVTPALQAWSPNFKPQLHTHTHTHTHTQRVQGQPGLHSEFQVNLGYTTRPCLKKKKNRGWGCLSVVEHLPSMCGFNLNRERGEREMRQAQD